MRRRQDATSRFPYPCQSASIHGLSDGFLSCLFVCFAGNLRDWPPAELGLGVPKVVRTIVYFDGDSDGSSVSSLANSCALTESSAASATARASPRSSRCAAGVGAVVFTSFA